MQKNEQQNIGKEVESESSDPIVRIGEKHLPGYFSPKDKVALIWSSAAVILGGAMLTAYLFATPAHRADSSAITLEQIPPLSNISIADESSWPKVIADKKQLVKIVKGFTTEVAGVNGWVIEQRDGGPETQSIVYTSANGDVAIIGGMVDHSGTSLSQEHFKLYVEDGESKVSNLQAQSNQGAPAQGQQQAPQQQAKIDYNIIKSTLSNQPFVSVGTGDKEVVVLIDPNCPYCHQYYSQLMSDAELLKTVTIKFMPVGILSMDSVQKSAIFDGLDAEKATSTLQKMMTGAITANNPSQEAIDRSMARTQSWSTAGLNVVPLTIVNFGEDGQTALPGLIGTAQLKNLL